VCFFLAFNFLAFDFLTLRNLLPPTARLFAEFPGRMGAVAVALVVTFPEGLVCVGALTFIPCNGKVLVLVTFDFVGNTGLFTEFPPNHDGNIDDKKPILF
jgi:hypothetical protein